ncbi:alpha/beta fold hydrolase [Amycolatopsis thermoflava]|uniref:alpha/beta fold hydrolase n=1 Tax=Amycolatopsis thermoflava TaxID=84480 RepID=UPI00380A4548
MTEIHKESVYFLGQGGRLAGDCWMPESPSRGTVLLLHGGGQTRHSWRAAGDTLAGAGWTTFAIDSRGHGDSDWALDGRYGLDAMVEDATEVVGALPQPPVVIGASLGGLTGLVLAGEQPAAIRGLVLVDAVPRIEPAGARRIAAFMHSAPDGFGSLEEVAEAIRAYQPQRSRPVNLDGLRKNVRQGPDGRWRWHWDPAFLRPPDACEAAQMSARVRVAAARVQAPTLLVRGGLSDVVTEDGASDLLRMIPHAKYADVAGTGHMVAGDDNSVFLTEVSGFLDDLDAPA